MDAQATPPTVPGGEEAPCTGGPEPTGVTGGRASTDQVASRVVVVGPTSQSPCTVSRSGGGAGFGTFAYECLPTRRSPLSSDGFTGSHGYFARSTPARLTIEAVARSQRAVLEAGPGLADTYGGP